MQQFLVLTLLILLILLHIFQRSHVGDYFLKKYFLIYLFYDRFLQYLS